MAEYVVQITIIEVYEEKIVADSEEEAIDKASQADWNNSVSFDSDYQVVEKIG